MEMTPQLALQKLKEGNDRFQNNFRTNRDLLQEVHDTGGGQNPFATILHCIDSRVSAELIFDQGVGDLFSARVAGNIVNEDILGSMEFANILSTSKLIMVMGHTSCGAVKGSIAQPDGYKNLTVLLEEIAKAIPETKYPENDADRVVTNPEFVTNVATTNVQLTLAKICNQSPTLVQRQKDGDIMIIGGMYDVSNGKVTFFDEVVCQDPVA